MKIGRLILMNSLTRFVLAAQASNINVAVAANVIESKGITAAFKQRVGHEAVTLGCLVGGVVVDDEMDVELGRHIGLDVALEGEELLVMMAAFALGDDRTVEHVEGGEEGGDTLTRVVVGDALDVAEHHGKQGWGPFEGLDLAPFTDTKHHSPVRWMR